MQGLWQHKSLSDMSDAEWESLCDHCGRCCLHKYEDEQGQLFFTNVMCRFYDMQEGCCSDYQARSDAVKECLHLRELDAQLFRWLPETCAYRLCAEGKDLPDWHPLRTGDAQSVQQAGYAMKDCALAEADVQDIEEHIVHWIR